VWEFEPPEYEPEGLIYLIPERKKLFLSFTDSTVAMNWDDFTSYRIEQNIINPSIIIYKKKDIKEARYDGEITRISVNEWDTLPIRVIGDALDDIYNYRIYRRLLPKTQAHFDSILFVSGGCYGSCPIFSLMIHSDGRVFFNGEKYTEKNGYYMGVLSQSQSKSILHKFQQVDFDSIIKSERIVADAHSCNLIIYSEGQKRQIRIDDVHELDHEPAELSILFHYLIELYKWVNLEEVSSFKFKDIEEIFPLPSVPELKTLKW
jgi:hypothetical protein